MLHIYYSMCTKKYTTKVAKANSHGNSLRCTIPQQVVSALNLECEDNIKWIIKENEGTTTVIVEKLIL